MKRMGRCGLLALAMLLAACATLPAPAERASRARAMAAARGWEELHLPVGAFTLTAFAPASIPGERLTIYFEGDGLAWITTRRPSGDPTPLNPLGLGLALAQPGGAAAYLARPGQFRPDEGVEQDYWTGRRFAPEVVDAENRAVDALKARLGARRLILVGYSGGGAVAALVAARRNDVDLLVTVAGNLCTTAWTSLHHISPLKGSLDPADHARALARIPQVHFAGGADTVIPPSLARDFAARFPADARPQVRVLPGMGHNGPWAQRWPELWRGIAP